MRKPTHSSQTQIKEIVQDIFNRNGGFHPTRKEVRQEYLIKYPEPDDTFNSQWHDFQKNYHEWLESLGPKNSAAKLECISNFMANIEKLRDELSDYLEKTRLISQDVFTGPSFYFHREAIKEARTNFLSERHLELIYAVLPAWGMHRMGSGKRKGKKIQKTAKVIDFEGKKGFRQQILCNDTKRKLIDLNNQGSDFVLNMDVGEIVDLIFSIRVSESDSYLVSSSKTLHHILPDLIPPIDRAYSIRFMRQPHDSFKYNPISIGDSNKRREKKLELEKKYARVFIEVMKNFIGDNEITKEMRKYRKYPFNTSLPKIFDNLIVAFIRDRRGDNDEHYDTDSL